jgi:hypothetical protein
VCFCQGVPSFSFSVDNGRIFPFRIYSSSFICLWICASPRKWPV